MEKLKMGDYCIAPYEFIKYACDLADERGMTIKDGSYSIILGCQTVTRAQIEGILEHMNKLKAQ